MRFPLALVLLLLSWNSPTYAASAAQAREVARLNNCPPKKIEVFQQTLGKDGETVYRVACNLPKSKDTNEATAASTASTLLIACNGDLCTLLRAVPDNEGK